MFLTHSYFPKQAIQLLPKQTHKKRQPFGCLILWDDRALQLAITGFRQHMGRNGLFSLHAAHCLIKSLAFHRGVGGNVQRFRPFSPGKSRRQLEQPASQALAPAVCGNVEAAQIGILLPASQQSSLHRREPFQLPFHKSPAHLAPGVQRVPQAAAQGLIVLIAPALGEGNVFHHPLALLLPPATFHHLEAVKAPKQLRRQLLLSQGAEHFPGEFLP